MTVSEKVGLGQQIEALQRPAAAERQAEGGGARWLSSRDLKQSRAPQTLEIAAEAVGMARVTYQRAKRKGFQRAKRQGFQRAKRRGSPLEFT